FGGGSVEDMPVKEIDANTESVIDVLNIIGLCKSRGEARRLIEGGGVSINDSKVSMNDVSLEAYKSDGEFILHKGKKIHFRVVLK
ncbi:MAG: tyrosine--tRNA ligase, partial [Clostridia bacterium]|nr:tyrosine--tRNA ligase [Clostridia bacterium]